MSVWAQSECRRRCWAVSTVAGGLVMLMLWLLAHVPLPLSAGVGAGVALASGAFLAWGVCSGSRRYRAAMDDAAAPEPVGVSEAGRPPPVHPAHTETTQPRKSAQTPAPLASLPPEPPVLISGAAKPVARRRPEERGLLGAVARTHVPVSSVAPSGAVRISAPRGGRADDLKRIRGIGPALEALLNSEGIWHFDQIASWKARDIAEIDARLGRFHGRIMRDEWVRQARILAAAGPEIAAHDPGEARDG